MKNKLFFSKLESSRFNLNFYRGIFDNIDVKLIQKTIITENIDISVIRIPSNKTYQLQQLSKLGFEYFQADTLVYYSVNLSNYKVKEVKNKDLKFVISKKEDQLILDKLIEEIFKNYQNHYFSNKYIDVDNSINGYKEWVFSFIEKEKHTVFIIYKEQIPIGFASCNINDENNSEGVLYGVLENYSGGGIYTDIIRYTQNYYKEIGVLKMKVSTQIQNYAVQKVWSREGFILTESYSTIHINSLLNTTIISEKDFFLEVNEDSLIKYGEISNDLNSIHYSDIDAKSLNFEGKIAHALLSEGEISRILGMEFPGNQTIILNSFNNFFAPLYPNRKYKFRLTVPFKNKNGFYKILFKVYDANDKLIMLSYNDVINNNI